MFPIWRFLKIEGTPCHHPVIDGIFHYLSCYWGTPTVGPPLPSWSIPDFFGRTMLDQNVLATVGCGCFAKETNIHSKPSVSPKLNRFGEFWVPHFRNKYGWPCRCAEKFCWPQRDSDNASKWLPKKSNAFGQPNDQMPFEGVWFELVSGPGGFLMAEASPVAGWFINVYNMYHGSHPWMMTGVPWLPNPPGMWRCVTQVIPGATL